MKGCLSLIWLKVLFVFYVIRLLNLFYTSSVHEQKSYRIFVLILFSLLLIGPQKLFKDLNSLICNQLHVLHHSFTIFVHQDLIGEDDEASSFFLLNTLLSASKFLMQLCRRKLLHQFYIIHLADLCM